MKRLLAGVVAASLASSAMANVGFEFGAQFLFPRLDSQGSGEHWIGQGQSFGVNWDIGNQLSLGAHAESLNMADGSGGTASFTAQAVTVSREMVRNANVGLRIGSFTDDYGSPYGSGLLADVLATLTLVRGQGDKVTGDLNVSVGARYADSTNNNSNANDWSGWFMKFGVGVGI